MPSTLSKPSHKASERPDHVTGSACQPAKKGTVPDAQALSVHMHLVHRIVAHFVRKLPRSVQREDLVAAGTLGLFYALRSSGDTAEACPDMFASYARIRIRGAILDELRRHDWSPRRRRADAPASTPASTPNTNVIPFPVRPATAAATQTSAASGPLAVANDAPEARIPIAVVGFDDLPPQESDSFCGDGATPFDHVEEKFTVEALRGAVAELPTRERDIIRMRYFEGLPSKAIASMMGLSEARISQLHARATARLREIMGGDLDLAA